MSLRLSAAVPRHAVPATARAESGVLRRQCACGRHTVGGGECGSCRSRRGTAFQQRAARAAPTDHGVTRCENGKLVPTVLKEHAIGNCVRVHEEAHVGDPHLAEACRRVTKCNERGDGGIPPAELDPTYPTEMLGNLCNTTYNEWFEHNRSNAELRAWSAEAACLRATIDARCGDAKSRASNTGGKIGATALGAGGGVGGAFAGVKAAEQLSSSGGDGVGGLVAGGIIGGVLGAGAGAGLGWLLGGWLGGLTAGSQASEEDCKSAKGELTECDIALRDYEGALPEPLPFEPDGRIIKSLTRGITKPRAAAPGGGSVDSKEPSGLLAIAGRSARRSRASRDLSAIPTLSAPPSSGFLSRSPAPRSADQAGAAI
jgi:hypothetical protein